MKNLSLIRQISWLLIFILLAACQPAPSPSATVSAGLSPEPTTASAEPTSPPTALPSATAEIHLATIQEIIASVDAHTRPGLDWEGALPDMLLYAGGEVWAKEASTALVDMQPAFSQAEGLVRVAPNTILTIEQPEANTLQLNLDEGQIWINIEGLAPGETFEVETPAAVASVRGTRFSVIVAADGTTVITCITGEIHVRSAGGTSKLTKYTQTTISPTGDIVPEEKINFAQRAAWNLASGPGLHIAVPLGSVAASMPLTTTIQEATWAGSNDLLRFRHYDEALGGYRYAQYDLAAGSVTNLPLIPANAYDLAFSPYGLGIAWINPDNMDFCVQADETAAPICTNADQSGYYDGPIAWAPGEEWLLHKIHLYDLSTPGEVKFQHNLYLSRADGSEGRQLTDNKTDDGEFVNYSWSPGGSQVAYAYVTGMAQGATAEVWVVNADGGTPYLLLDNALLYTEAHQPLAWSPDGQWLAVVTQQGLVLASADGQDIRTVQDTGPGYYSSLIWAPTASGFPLIYSYYDEQTSSGGEGMLTSAEAAPVEAWLFAVPNYAPDGSRALFTERIPIDSSDPNAGFTTTLWVYNILPWWP